MIGLGLGATHASPSRGFSPKKRFREIVDVSDDSVSETDSSDELRVEVQEMDADGVVRVTSKTTKKEQTAPATIVGRTLSKD